MSDSSMRFSFRPEFEGQISAAHVSEDFFARMGRRVAEGLWSPGRRARANYRVTASSRDSLSFEAEDFLTAYNIGLNEVELRRAGPDLVAYRVRFHRWSRYARIHAAVIGSTLAALYLVPDLRHQVTASPLGVLVFWGMIAFWGLAWPWIMTALHRPFARQALERVLESELGAGGSRRGAA